MAVYSDAVSTLQRSCYLRTSDGAGSSAFVANLFSLVR